MIPGYYITIYSSATNDRDVRLLLQLIGLLFYGKVVNQVWDMFCYCIIIYLYKIMYLVPLSRSQVSYNACSLQQQSELVVTNPAYLQPYYASQVDWYTAHQQSKDDENGAVPKYSTFLITIIPNYSLEPPNKVKE